MTWRPCDDGDVGMINAHLDRHRAETMFLSSNLRKFGMGGDHPLSLSVWWDGANLLGLTRAGMLMPCAPHGPDWAALAHKLGEREISGLVGPAQQVRPLQSAFGLDALHTLIDHDDPHYHLALGALIMSPVEGFSLRPITEGNRQIAENLRAAYQTETLGTPAADAASAARDDITAYITAQSHVVLLRGEEPVAMTGFNATSGDMVQIGGVYTPPDLRGQGFARRAVALHLRAARSRGFREAVLSAANTSAARAYCAIGFRQIGVLSLIRFAKAQTL